MRRPFFRRPPQNIAADSGVIPPPQPCSKRLPERARKGFEVTDTTVPRAPRGLKTRGRAVWRELHEQFDFAADPHRHLLVEDICRTTDVIDRLQSVVDTEDLRVRGSQGQPVAAPAIGELRAQRALLGQLITRLGLPETDEVQEAKDARVSEVRRTAGRARFKSVG